MNQVGICVMITDMMDMVDMVAIIVLCARMQRYYPQGGRIEDKEVLSWYQKRKRKHSDQLLLKI